MQTAPGNDLSDDVERLVAELRAIERWGAQHWRNIRPKLETIASATRQNRRSEILSQLLSIIPQLDKSRRATRLGREEIKRK
jgi:hypothetical protein